QMGVANNASDRRAAPRFEVVAQGSGVSGDDVHVLSVINISPSGAFLAGRPRDHVELVPGVEIDISLSATGPGMADDEMLNIECRGRVVRTELRPPTSPGGFAIPLEPKTAEDQERFEDLLSRLISTPAAQRSVSLG